MDNNYTVKKRHLHDWLVYDEYGNTAAILHELEPNRWQAWGWEYGDRLMFGEDDPVFDYRSQPDQSALEIAQLLDL